MRKVNELVREIVADEVGKLKDPRIGFVTVTGAETSPDLHYSIVYYSAMGSDDEKAATAAGLVSATPRLQRMIASQVRMRNTPKLEFRVDPSIDEGIRISEKLRELDDAPHEQPMATAGDSQPNNDGDADA
jgi:ribosome-binding factor A